MQSIRLDALTAGSTGDVSLTAVSTDAGSSSSSFTATASGTVLAGGSGTVAYFYRLQYAANGNIANTTDMYNGNGLYGYDTLNRLTVASRTHEGPINGVSYAYQCWSYDAFGNRLSEVDQNVVCPGQTPGASNFSGITSYNANNQVLSTTMNAAGVYVYDVAGNVVNDGINRYVYDIEGRICAVWNTNSNSKTQYVYDAEGRRVANGALSGANAALSFPTGSTVPACGAPTAANGFAVGSIYLRGQQGNQDTELTGTGSWKHTNVFSGEGLTATYWTGTSGPELSYDYSDWLGTKRMQANTNPSAELMWQSDPFGDWLNPYGSGTSATEHQFTGKERDSESGNDYFGARYYASSMGRWTSPDWASNPVTIPFGNLADPQSLNLYSYVGNNPMNRFDPYGHLECASATQDVACAVTAAAKAVWGFLTSGSDSSSNNSSSNGTVSVSSSASFQGEDLGPVQTHQQSLFPRSFSLNLGASAEAGLGAGFAGTLQGSLVADTTNNKLKLYSQGTAGGTYANLSGNQSPDPKDWVWSLYAGGGLSVSASNGSPDQLAGKAHTYNFGGRWLPYGLGVSYSYTGNSPWKPGVYQLTVAPPGLNWGAGVQASHYNTWTSDPTPIN